MGFLRQSPAAAVKRPKATRPEMRYWTPQQAKTFLQRVAGDRLRALWLLLVTRGLRRGEALGLRWTSSQDAWPSSRLASTSAIRR